MQPLVSIVIATYNWKEKWFKQTLDSILWQTYKNIEIIIINDASTNNIEEVILKYNKEHNNIVYLKNERNSERSYSRNRWIFESRWKYIAFCDDDDIWKDKDKLKKQVKLLEDNEEYVMCWTSMIIIDENDMEVKKNIHISWNEIIRKSILIYNPFALSSVIVRKSVLLYSWLFNSDFNSVEDYDLWLRIGRFWKMCNIRDSFIFYRTRQGNTSTTSSLKQRKLSFKSMWNNKKFYPNFLKALVWRVINMLSYLLSSNS